MPSKYEENTSDPVNRFGPCPDCGTSLSKIIWGFHGVCCDLVCSDGHFWTHWFSQPSREALLKGACEALMAQANRVSDQASYFIVGERKCDLCKVSAHSDKCELGKLERLVVCLGDIGNLHFEQDDKSPSPKASSDLSKKDEVE